MTKNIFVSPSEYHETSIKSSVSEYVNLNEDDVVESFLSKCKQQVVVNGICWDNLIMVVFAISLSLTANRKNKMPKYYSKNKRIELLRLVIG